MLQPLFFLVCSASVLIARNIDHLPWENQTSSKHHHAAKRSPYHLFNPDHHPTSTFQRKCCLCGVVLLIGYLNLSTRLPFSTLNTNTSARRTARMLLVALIWVLWIRTISLIICPVAERSTTADSNVKVGVSEKKTNGEINSNHIDASSVSSSASSYSAWYKYLCRELFWYAFPLRRASSKIPRLYLRDFRRSIFWPFLVRFTLETLVLIICKALLTEGIYLYFQQCTSAPNDALRQNYLKLAFYSWLEGSFVLAASYMMDLQRYLVVVLTGGRYDLLYTHNYAMLSNSVSEFWGGRYNLLIHTLLKESLYKPLRFKAKWSKEMATIATFALSGVLHVHVVYAVFGERCRKAMLFFLLQAIPMIVFDAPASRAQVKNRGKKDEVTGKPIQETVPKIPSLFSLPENYSFKRNAATAAFLFFTMPLYMGTLALHLPEFNSKPATFVHGYVHPFVARLPCVASSL